MDKPNSPNAPWSPVRLLKTLTFFETIPFGAALGVVLFGSKPVPAPHITPTVTGNDAMLMLFDFRQPNPEQLQAWGALDDVVMGGVSASGFQPLSRSALFTGNVSIANSGGFASVRTKNLQPVLDLGNYTGIELRLKGDGNRYKFFLRSDDRWDGIGYAHSFDTVAGEWITVRIPFATLVPVLRAKTVANAPQLNARQIYSFQIMLSKFEYDGQLNPHFQAGAFKLELETISAYGD
jgi:hypothetical protein